MVINFDVFRGMRWQLSAGAAGKNYASIAHNIWRRNASFEPLRVGDRMETVPNHDWRSSRSFFLHDEQFVSSRIRRDFASTQTIGDRSRRLFTIGESGLLLHLPKHEIPEGYPTSFGGGHRCGVPEPKLMRFTLGTPGSEIGTRDAVSGLQFTNSSNIGDEDDPDTVKTTLVYTYVNRYGEEGPPSRPSFRVRMDAEGQTRVSIRTLASGNPDVIGIRVYFLVGNEYFRAASPEVEFEGSDLLSPVPNLTGLGDGGEIKDIGLNPAAFLDLLVTQDWDSAPENLGHLASLAGGVLAVADDHTVYTSVPYQWHAFPASNRYPVNGVIRRIVRTSGGLAVLTDRGVEFLVVAGEGQLVEIGEKFPYAIADPESLCQIDGGHGFVCEDGIAAIGASGGTIMTDGWIDREAWRERVTPLESRAGLYDGRMLVATRHPETGQPIGYALNLAAQEVTSFDVKQETLVSGFWRHPRTNELGYVLDSDSFSVFNRGTEQLGIWEAEDIEVPGSMPLNSVAVEARDAGPVTVVVTPEYTGSAARRKVESRRPVRMRSTSRSGSLRVRVESSRPVSRVRLASSLGLIA